jgi:hypothetical protein
MHKPHLWGVRAMDTYQFLVATVLSLDAPCFAGAKVFHAEIESRLRKVGCSVIKEYRVKDRGDGREGYIDLVVHAPFRAAIELDNVRPRIKSVFKLRSFSGERFVILRRSKKVLRVARIARRGSKRK